MSISIHQLKERLSPEEFSGWLIEQGPIFWWPKGNFWVITDYQIAKQLLTGNQVTCNRAPFFLSRMPNVDLSLLPDFFSIVSQMMVMRDDEAHQATRRICYHGFANSHLQQLIPGIKHLTEQLIQQLTDKDTVDFVSHFAEQIPMQTLADFFDIPEADRVPFAAYAKTMTAFFGGGSHYDNEAAIKANTAAKNLKAYFIDLCKERRQQTKEDFLSQLIKHQPHFGLTDEELIAQAIMMWVAGMVTTADQMANNCFTLVHEYSQLLQSKPSFAEFEAIIQECNRLDPAVTFTFRLANQDILVSQKTIQQGQTIFISNHAINRDPKTYATPESINLAHTKPHFAYGMGSHFCLGAKLSMIEMNHCLFALFNQFPKARLGDFKRNHYSLSFSGFHHLELDLLSA
jgi:cytochrome P450